MKYEKLNKKQLIAELEKCNSQLKKYRENDCRSNLELKQRLLEERDLNLRLSERVAKIGHFSLNRTDNKIRTSEQFKEIFELDENEQFDLKRWVDFIHPDFADKIVYNTLEEIIENELHFDKEYKIITSKSKTIKWVHGLGRPILEDNGKVLGLFGTVQDITDRKIIELELEEKELDLEESQRIAKIGHYTANREKGEFTASEQFKEIFEVDQDFQFNFQSWLSFIHPEFKEKISHQYLVEILQNNKSVEAEYKITTLKTKQERWIYGIGKPLLNNEGITIGSFGTVQDITERKRIEEAHIESEVKFQKLFDKSLDAILLQILPAENLLMQIDLQKN